MILLAIVLALAPQDEAAAKAALETYKTATAKSKDPKAHADAVSELAKTPHEKVAAMLGSLLTTDDKDVRIAAAAGLATFTQPAELKSSAAKHLTQALTAGANAKMIDVRVAIFAALGALQEESSANAVKSHFDDKDPKIACAAVSAAGQMKSKSLVEPLIQLLRDCEKTVNGGALPLPPPVKGKPAPPPPPQKDLDREKKDRANAVMSAAGAALGALTGQSFKSSDEWERWWIKNRSTFTPK
jgi:HEAT repeat protein